MTGSLDMTVETRTLRIVIAKLENCDCPVLEITLAQLPNSDFHVVSRLDVSNVKMLVDIRKEMKCLCMWKKGSEGTFAAHVQRWKRDKLATVVLRSIVAPWEHFPSTPPFPQVKQPAVEYHGDPICITGRGAHLPNKVHCKAGCPHF